MSQVENAVAKTSAKRTRRTQERAETTRANLIDAGKLLFSERGFDAVSVRDLENAAGVKRNIACAVGGKCATKRVVVGTGE